MVIFLAFLSFLVVDSGVLVVLVDFGAFVVFDSLEFDFVVLRWVVFTFFVVFVLAFPVVTIFFTVEVDTVGSGEISWTGTG